MSENPKEPWGSEDDHPLNRYAKWLGEWADRCVEIEKKHYEGRIALEERHFKRTRLLFCICTAWVALGIGIHLGERNYAGAAVYLGTAFVGLATGHALSALSHWAFTRWERRRAAKR